MSKTKYVGKAYGDSWGQLTILEAVLGNFLRPGWGVL